MQQKCFKSNSCSNHTGEGKCSSFSGHEACSVEPYLICPECGHYPLTLKGKRTLTLQLKNKKAYCQNCMFEQNF